MLTHAEISSQPAACHALRQALSSLYHEETDHILRAANEDDSYWSNMSKSENARLIAAIATSSCAEAIDAHHPALAEVIFSPKRTAGLELLELSSAEVCADYGCMWGALTVPLARRCGYVVGFDQTLDSLKFARKRTTEEGLRNIDFVYGNLKRIQFPTNFFDVAVVNGVLEWIPESGHIDLTTYYAKFEEKRVQSRPRDEQVAFLKAVHGSLKDSGRLYLAIENRYDYKMFFGVPDPHPGIPFTSILPRAAANLVSSIRLGRKYVNYTYSFRELDELVREAGFVKVDLYMCWPDYRFPQKILAYRSGLSNFKPLASSRNSAGRRSFRRTIAKGLESLLFTVGRARYLAPSIIAIAHK